MRKILALLLIAAVCWAAGLLGFAGRVQRSTPAKAPAAAQGVVALTGGSTLRLVEATRLLEQGKARRLLVSGVNPEASRADIRDVTNAVRPVYDCCVDLGFEAADTVGNAREIADWARKNAYSRLIVVTADYHMPRAMLEIRGALPEAQLTPYPVATGTLDARRWRQTRAGVRRMLVEYNKYLLVFTRERILGLGKNAREGETAPPAVAP